MNQALLDKLNLDDLCVDLSSSIEQHGARYVLSVFESRYPNHFRELVAQLHRRSPQQVPVLFKPPVV